jgi:hypothetical protein
MISEVNQNEKYDIVVFENMNKKISHKEIEDFLESSKSF